jgi:glycerate 2-kinase
LDIAFPWDSSPLFCCGEGWRLGNMRGTFIAVFSLGRVENMTSNSRLTGNQLAQMREDAMAIFQGGLAAVEPRRAVLNHLSLAGGTLTAGAEHLQLPPEGRVFLVGAGKAAAPMAAAVEEVLGERLARGVVVTKYGHHYPMGKTRLLEAGHPVPDRNGLAASGEIAALLEEAREGDLVIVVLSGGGSALLPAPPPSISLEEKMAVTSLLLGCGATINEINAVRKHLSLLKGGGMARLAAPAGLLTLILSDVVGDPLDVIASGPTVPDPSTFTDALGIVQHYRLEGEVPPTVLAHLQRGAAGSVPETPKGDALFFRSTINLLVGNNAMAIAAAAAKARQLGYSTLILSTTITGETRPVAGMHAAMAREIVATGNPLPPPVCLMSGGETTVTLRGNGKGGRNQEFALAAALEIEDLPGVLILSAGTDGTDGPTDATGAFADGTTVRRGRAANLDALSHLEKNDAYPFFAALHDLLQTGPTNTNVMDLRLVLVKPAGTG